MNKYTEANKRLALAFGWADIVEVGGALLGTPPDGALGSRGQAMVPDWCGDWRECGPLVPMYCCGLIISAKTSAAASGDSARNTKWSERHVDHASKEAAIMYSIVCASIESLRVEKYEAAK